MHPIKEGNKHSPSFIDINSELSPFIEKLNTHKVSITGTGKPKIGAHGKPVVFLHPKDCNGTLIELEEV